MPVSLRRSLSSEQHSLEHCVNTYPQTKQEVKTLLTRITKFFNVKKHSSILEIGAAQGKVCLAFQSLGYSCSGIEPYEPAIAIAHELATKYKMRMVITKGVGEDISKPSQSCDLVIALSVLEHVTDIEAVFKEVGRVLKPRGAFYFYTISSLCPCQSEIRFFPFFSWYPQRVKSTIMHWAMKHHPSLVGYTTAPAINWFTPWTTRKRLQTAGFTAIYDRWDLVDEASYTGLGKIILRIIRSHKIMKVLADLVVPNCAYLAIKNPSYLTIGARSRAS
jgi:2-polyprenyl-3-methyl-5-hydroxy-6-metoxy-1,4-benzoquinol methylase